LGTRHRKKTWTPPRKINRITLDTRHRKINTDIIRYKTQKEDTNRTTKRWSRVTLGTRHRKKTHTPPKKIDTGNIGHKTQKEDTNPIRKDKHG
jgi:hypothetical protein